MQMVDMTHTMNVHTPGWVGYAGNKMFYTQNLQTQRIVAQRVEMALHTGTHLDGAMHGADGMGDMASYDLPFLVNKGAIVDISDMVDDWSVITPDMLTANVEIEKGDILIIHTGWHKYWEGQSQQDLVRYFTMHPGGKLELLQWMLDMEIKWFGIDAGSGDHPMWTTIRNMRPDLTKVFEEQVGMPVDQFFPRYEYTHKLSGRRVSNDLFPFHNWAFQENLIHAENVGGDIEKALNTRAIIGAFPWKYEGLEASPCRIIAFYDVGDLKIGEYREAASELATE
ncbi:MAG: cyclase family protein [Acidimicrobiia bacterium]|nr:cyclase family protein [Acidimicrobiia bacterium]MDH4306409.1 cyclase family protein [Acidimicrobiia bacterium]